MSNQPEPVTRPQAYLISPTSLEFRELYMDIDEVNAYIFQRDRDVKVLETRIGALESLRRADTRARERMRERLDKYGSSDWRQKEELTKQAKTIERLTTELNRVTPFLALHGVEGYAMMEPVEDWGHPIGITFSEVPAELKEKTTND